MTRVTLYDKEFTYEAAPDFSLLDLLRSQGVYMNAPCNGMGRCGKCAVTLLEGEFAISGADRNFFTPEELDAGRRLACTAYPTSDISIRIEDDSSENNFEVLGTSRTGTSNCQSSSDVYPCSTTSTTLHELAIAIDLGTTTIAAVLLDAVTGAEVASASSLNHQRAYGADVISRIKSANEGHLSSLQQSVIADLRGVIHTLLQSATNQVAPFVTRIVIGANTTMVHLLMGYSCESLGSYPFTPVNIGTIHLSARELLGASVPDCTLTILPGISTFVGGDIVSGIHATHLAQQEEISFLVDLGTNGEIALGNRDKILVTSTAAGPAFEGGNITWGTGSIPGSISNFDIIGGQPVLNIIGSSAPVKASVTAESSDICGICGTGVVAITSTLLRHGLINESGVFYDSHYQKEGYPIATASDGRTITFTQSDIRTIQLAKAAICAGMEILMKRYGVTADQVAHVYIAGGFGQKLDKRKALSLGLFPASFKNKIEMVGNSCLNGAIQVTQSALQSSVDAKSNVLRELECIKKKSAEISLSTDSEFNDLYVGCMNF